MRCAARATLWPTPPRDRVIRAGLEVWREGVLGGVEDELERGVKSQERSTARLPATKTSAGVSDCFAGLVVGGEDCDSTTGLTIVGEESRSPAPAA